MFEYDQDIVQNLLKDSIELAITTEKLGAGFYSKLAEKFEGDKEISELFSILAKDEKTHEKQFRKLLDKVPAEGEDPETDETKVESYSVPRTVSVFHISQTDVQKGAQDAAV